MKIMIRRSCLFLVVVFQLFGCAKDKESPLSGSSSVAIPHNNSNCGRLLKSIEVDNIRNEFISKKEFQYDKMNRISAITWTVENKKDSTISMEDILFYWSTSGDTLYKTSASPGPRVGILSESVDSNIYYYSNGRLTEVVEFGKNPSNYNKRYFKYSQTGSILEIIAVSFGIFGGHQDIYKFQKAGGGDNISNVSFDINGSWIEEYEYDTLPNPFKCIPFHYGIDFPVTFFNQNNVLKKRRLQNGDLRYEGLYSYINDSKGYPVEILLMDYGDTTSITRITYQ